MGEAEVQKLFVAVRAFVIYDGKVLLIQESSEYKDSANVGKWDVPGGRVEPGEKWNEAFFREIKEETGLNVEIGRPFAMSEWRPQVRGEHWQIVGTFFECSVIGEPKIVLSEDHSSFKWVAPEDILTLENCAAAVYEVTKKYLEVKRA